MKTPLIIWLLCDGKPGHENQSLGLADALARQVACEVHRISLADEHGLFQRVKSALAASKNFPNPNLIIGAGHATHFALLWLTRKHHAKSIVLMRPSLPLSWFDLCIAPSHDFPKPPQRANLVLSRGALNRVSPGDGVKSGKLILIGGPSKTHGWDDAAVLDMLAQATDRGGWELTDSRRTPNDFLGQACEQLPGVTGFSHHETPPDWVPDKLRRAKEVWVSEDSISMIYEALGSGARVGLLPVPRLKTDSRVLRGIDSLVADGFLTPFAEWRNSGRLPAPPETLREADRCATEVIARLMA
ncbi:MAG: mitochondrial fission ELM1 family protein [Luteolibacter sp.]